LSGRRDDRCCWHCECRSGAISPGLAWCTAGPIKLRRREPYGPGATHP
jgi:hypothetical protein